MGLIGKESDAKVYGEGVITSVTLKELIFVKTKHPFTGKSMTLRVLDPILIKL